MVHWRRLLERLNDGGVNKPEDLTAYREILAIMKSVNSFQMDYY